jgi:hypothetical protein
MDLFNPDTWKQQWMALANSPYATALVVAIAVWVGWWLRGIRSKRKIVGLNSVFEERLKLAAEQAALADQAKSDLGRQFEVYKAQVAANAETAALTAAAAEVDRAFLRFAGANNTMSSILSRVL